MGLMLFRRRHSLLLSATLSCYSEATTSYIDNVVGYLGGIWKSVNYPPADFISTLRVCISAFFIDVQVYIDQVRPRIYNSVTLARELVGLSSNVYLHSLK